MILLVKIICIAVLSVVSVLILKQTKPEFALFITLAAGIVVTFMVLGEFTSLLSEFNKIVSKTGVNSGLFKTILKIIGLGYLTEFAYSLCTDSGVSSLGDKIVFAGKVVILAEVVPIATSLINMLLEVL